MSAILMTEQHPENKAFWDGVQWAQQGASMLIPSEWLKPGAVVPVTPETVSTLLTAVRILAGRSSEEIEE